MDHKSAFQDNYRSRVLGLDPGLRYTGWGIVDVFHNQLYHVAHGTIKVPEAICMSQRLAQLFEGLQGVIEDYTPTEAAVEETFLNKNPSTTLRLGQARGVLLLAPALNGITVGEYSANHVKKMVVGAGHADKNQVAMMVKRFLPNCGTVTSDEADALAVAICHAHTLQSSHHWHKRVS